MRDPSRVRLCDSDIGRVAEVDAAGQSDRPSWEYHGQATDCLAVPSMAERMDVDPKASNGTGCSSMSKATNA